VRFITSSVSGKASAVTAFFHPQTAKNAIPAVARIPLAQKTARRNQSVEMGELRPVKNATMDQPAVQLAEQIARK